MLASANELSVHTETQVILGNGTVSFITEGNDLNKLNCSIPLSLPLTISFVREYAEEGCFCPQVNYTRIKSDCDSATISTLNYSRISDIVINDNSDKQESLKSWIANTWMPTGDELDSSKTETTQWALKYNQMKSDYDALNRTFSFINSTMTTEYNSLKKSNNTNQLVLAILSLLCFGLIFHVLEWKKFLMKKNSGD